LQKLHHTHLLLQTNPNNELTGAGDSLRPVERLVVRSHIQFVMSFAPHGALFVLLHCAVSVLIHTVLCLSFYIAPHLF